MPEGIQAGSVYISVGLDTSRLAQDIQAVNKTLESTFKSFGIKLNVQIDQKQLKQLANNVSNTLRQSVTNANLGNTIAQSIKSSNIGSVLRQQLSSPQVKQAISSTAKEVSSQFNTVAQKIQVGFGPVLRKRFYMEIGIDPTQIKNVQELQNELLGITDQITDPQIKQSFMNITESILSSGSSIDAVLRKATYFSNGLLVIFKNLNKQTSTFQLGLDNVTDPLLRLSRVLNQLSDTSSNVFWEIGREFDNLGFRLTRSSARFSFMIAPIIATFGLALNQFKEFDETLRKIGYAGKYSENILEDLNRRISETALRFGVSTGDLASFSREVISSGVSISELEESLDDLARVALLSTDSISQLGYKLFLIADTFEDSTLSITDFANMLLNVTNMTRTEIGTFTDAISRFAPAISAFMIPPEQAYATVGLLSQYGLTGKRAGTLLQSAFFNFYKILEEVGIETRDATGNFKDFFTLAEEFMTLVRATGEPTINVLQKLGAQQTTIKAFSLLLRDGTESLRTLADRIIGTTPTIEELGQVLESPFVAMNRLREAIGMFMRSLGSIAFDAFKPAIEAVTGFLVALTRFIERNRTLASIIFRVIGVFTLMGASLAGLGLVVGWTAEGLGALFTLLGISKSAFGSLGLAVLTVKSIFASLVPAILNTVSAVKALVVALTTANLPGIISALKNPFLLALMAIGLVSYGIIKLVEHFRKLNETQKESIAITKSWSTIFRDAINQVIASSPRLGEAFAKGFTSGFKHEILRTTEFSDVLEGKSPAKEGPFSLIDTWGFNLGKTIGSSFALGFKRSFSTEIKPIFFVNIFRKFSAPDSKQIKIEVKPQVSAPDFYSSLNDVLKREVPKFKSFDEVIGFQPSYFQRSAESIFKIVTSTLKLIEVEAQKTGKVILKSLVPPELKAPEVPLITEARETKKEVPTPWWVPIIDFFKDFWDRLRSIFQPSEAQTSELVKEAQAQVEVPEFKIQVTVPQEARQITKEAQIEYESFVPKIQVTVPQTAKQTTRESQVEYETFTPKIYVTIPQEYRKTQKQDAQVEYQEFAPKIYVVIPQEYRKTQQKDAQVEYQEFIPKIKVAIPQEYRKTQEKQAEVSSQEFTPKIYVTVPEEYRKIQQKEATVQTQTFTPKIFVSIPQEELKKLQKTGEISLNFQPKVVVTIPEAEKAKLQKEGQISVQRFEPRVQILIPEAEFEKLRKTGKISVQEFTPQISISLPEAELEKLRKTGKLNIQQFDSNIHITVSDQEKAKLQIKGKITHDEFPPEIYLWIPKTELNKLKKEGTIEIEPFDATVSISISKQELEKLKKEGKIEIEQFEPVIQITLPEQVRKNKGQFEKEAVVTTEEFTPKITLTYPQTLPLQVTIGDKALEQIKNLVINGQLPPNIQIDEKGNLVVGGKEVAVRYILNNKQVPFNTLIALVSLPAQLIQIGNNIAIQKTGELYLNNIKFDPKTQTIELRINVPGIKFENGNWVIDLKELVKPEPVKLPSSEELYKEWMQQEKAKQPSTKKEKTTAPQQKEKEITPFTYIPTPWDYIVEGIGKLKEKEKEDAELKELSKKVIRDVGGVWLWKETKQPIKDPEIVKKLDKWAKEQEELIDILSQKKPFIFILPLPTSLSPVTPPKSPFPEDFWEFLELILKEPTASLNLKSPYWTPVGEVKPIAKLAAGVGDYPVLPSAIQRELTVYERNLERLATELVEPLLEARLSYFEQTGRTFEEFAKEVLEPALREALGEEILTEYLPPTTSLEDWLGGLVETYEKALTLNEERKRRLTEEYALDEEDIKGETDKFKNAVLSSFTKDFFPTLLTSITSQFSKIKVVIKDNVKGIKDLIPRLNITKEVNEFGLSLSELKDNIESYSEVIMSLPEDQAQSFVKTISTLDDQISATKLKTNEFLKALRDLSLRWDTGLMTLKKYSANFNLINNQVENFLKTLASRSKELENRIAQLHQENISLKDLIATGKQRIELLEKEKDLLKKRVEGIQTFIQALKDFKITDTSLLLSKDLNQILEALEIDLEPEQVRMLKEFLDATFGAGKWNLAVLKANINEIERTFNTLKRATDSTTKSIDEEIDKIKKNVEVHENRVRANNELIQAYSQEQKTIDEVKATLRDAQKTTDEYQKTMENVADSVKSSIKDLAETIFKLDFKSIITNIKDLISTLVSPKLSDLKKQFTTSLALSLEKLIPPEMIEAEMKEGGYEGEEGKAQAILVAGAKVVYNQFEKLAEPISSLISKTLGLSGVVAETISSLAGLGIVIGTVFKALDLLAPLLETFSDIVNSLLNLALLPFMSTIQTINTLLQPFVMLMEYVIKIFMAPLNAIAELNKKLITTKLDLFIEKITNMFMLSYKIFLEPFLPVIDNLLAILTNVIGALVVRLAPLTALVTTLSSLVLIPLINALIKLSETTKKVAEAMVKNALGVLNMILGILKTLRDLSITILGNVIQPFSFLSGIVDILENVSDNLQNFLDNLADASDYADVFADSLSEITEQLTNVPEGFKVALYRFEAMQPRMYAPFYSLADLLSQLTGIPLGGTREASGYQINIDNVTIVTDDPKEFYEQMKKLAVREKYIRTGAISPVF